MNYESLVYDISDSKIMCLRYSLFNSQPTQTVENEQQIINHTVPNLDMNQRSAMQFPLNMNLYKTLVQPESSLEASGLPVRDFNPDLHHCNVDILTPSKPSSSHARYFKNESV